MRKEDLKDQAPQGVFPFAFYYILLFREINKAFYERGCVV